VSRKKNPTADSPRPRTARKISTRKARKIIGGTAAVAMVSLSSYAAINAVAATATLPIIARIIRAIEITVNTSLDFGTLAVTADNAGAATVDPNSGLLTFSGLGGVNLAGGTPRAGRIQIRGAAVPVQVSMENNNVQITNGTTFLTINAFNFGTANGGPQITVTPGGPADSAVIAVGATINTRPRQLTGTYIGSNTVFANYQ
jgi:hypothetical protein